MNKGTNSSKITISLKKAERAKLCEWAEHYGMRPATLAAELIREHIRLTETPIIGEGRTPKDGD